MAEGALSVPLGIKELLSLERVVVSSQPNGVFSGNKYMVSVPDGATVLVVEEMGFQLLRDKNRGFRFTITDSNQAKIAEFSRNERWSVTTMNISIGGVPFCDIHEKPTLVDTVLNFVTVPHGPAMRIKGYVFEDRQEVYQLQTMDKKRIGHVKKIYEGLMKELFTPFNTYELEFPLDLDVNCKLSVIAACVLIDFLRA